MPAQAMMPPRGAWVFSIHCAVAFTAAAMLSLEVTLVLVNMWVSEVGIAEDGGGLRSRMET